MHGNPKNKCRQIADQENTNNRGKRLSEQAPPFSGISWSQKSHLKGRHIRYLRASTLIISLPVMKPDIIKGYTLLQPIFRGGMTDVYIAKDADGRRVVIRFLKRTFARDRALRKRFLLAAEILRSLDHPTIVPLIEVGNHKDIPYTIMKYVDARTLRDLLIQRDPIISTSRLVILRQMAGALYYIHQAGYLHLDFKPENVLVEMDAKIHVIDFDLSVKRARTPVKLNDCAGTPAYVAPEIMTHRRADERADIFSFGVVAYELWTGHKPFERNTLDEERNAQINPCVEPCPPTRFAPDLPPALESIILKSLAKDPDKRYPSMSLILKAIDTLR